MRSAVPGKEPGVCGCKLYAAQVGHIPFLFLCYWTQLSLSGTPRRPATLQAELRSSV